MQGESVKFRGSRSPGPPGPQHGATWNATGGCPWRSSWAPQGKAYCTRTTHVTLLKSVLLRRMNQVGVAVPFCSAVKRATMSPPAPLGPLMLSKSRTAPTLTTEGLLELTLTLVVGGWP